MIFYFQYFRIEFRRIKLSKSYLFPIKCPFSMHFISYDTISYVCMQSGLTRSDFGIKIKA